MTPCSSSGMLKKLKAKRRRAKVKRLLKDHASEILIGALVGLLTDILTDVAQRKLRRVF